MSHGTNFELQENCKNIYVLRSMLSKLLKQNKILWKRNDYSGLFKKSIC